MAHCYQCDKETTELSGRGRCAICEHVRAVANEQENEKLRAHIEELRDVAVKAHAAFSWLSIKALIKEDRAEHKRRADVAWALIHKEI